MRLLAIFILALPLAAQVNPKTQVCTSSVSGTCASVTADGIEVQGAGTAGAAAGGVMTIQGSASGTAVPISGTVTITPSGTQVVSNAGVFAVQNTAATPAGSNVIGHVIADTGSTTAVTSLPATPAGSNIIGNVRIDQTTPGTTNKVDIGTNGTVAIGTALPAGSAVIGKVSIDQTTPGTTNLVALAPNQSVNVAQVGGAAPDPCFGLLRTPFSISQTGNAQIITGVSAKKIYICSIWFVAPDAESITVVEGTGSICATSTIAVPGFPAATAANGAAFAANGGISANGGSGQMGSTSVNADNVCLFQSGSGRVAGGGTFVPQ